MRYGLLIAPLLFVLLGRPCAAQAGHYDGDAVARAGDRVVTFGDVARSWGVAPQWHRGQQREKAYRAQLDYVIDEKLLAQHAETLGLQQAPGAAAYLRFIEDKAVVRALYRREVTSRIDVTDDDLAQAYALSKRRVKLRYVTTPDAARAAAYAQALRSTPFDSLSMPDPADHKDVTDWLGFGDVAPELESMVFWMAPGEVGGPVAAGDRYVVVQLAEGQVERFASAWDLAQQRNRLTHLIQERRAAPLAARYVADLMEDEHVRLDAEGFAALGQRLSEVIDAADAPVIRLSDDEVDMVAEGLPLTGDEVVVTYASGQMTARDVLRELSFMPESLLRPGRPLAPQLKDAIGVLVRNRCLARRGRGMELDTLRVVRREVQAQRDAFLARLWRKQVLHDVTVTDADVEAFKQTNTYARLKARLGEALDDAYAGELLRTYALATRETDLLKQLRQRYAVSVDENRFADKVPHGEKAIGHDPVPLVAREIYR